MFVRRQDELLRGLDHLRNGIKVYGRLQSIQFNGELIDYSALPLMLGDKMPRLLCCASQYFPKFQRADGANPWPHVRILRHFAAANEPPDELFPIHICRFTVCQPRPSLRSMAFIRSSASHHINNVSMAIYVVDLVHSRPISHSQVWERRPFFERRCQTSESWVNMTDFMRRTPLQCCPCSDSLQ